MKRRKKFIVIIIVAALIFIISIVSLSSIVIRDINFNKKYGIIINQSDGEIEITNEIKDIFENDKVFTYMVGNLSYNNDKNETRRIQFIDYLIYYLDDVDKLNKVDANEYNLPIIEEGIINRSMKKKDFIKYFYDTYGIRLSDYDITENEDFMGALYFDNNTKKIYFSKQNNFLHEYPYVLFKINKIVKSNNIYDMNINFYNCKNVQEYNQTKDDIRNNKNVQNNSISTTERNVKFKLNKYNKYFNYTLLSIE